MDRRRFDEAARRRVQGRVRRDAAAVLIGVDESGRGPLAGPVVVVAVALPEVPSRRMRGVRDSKQMTRMERERLFKVIVSHATAVSVAWAHPPIIDRDNILRATLDAMGRAARRAARKAGTSPALVLVDGPHRIPTFELSQEAVIEGDMRSLSVAAASVVAKVVRDRWMARLERRYPGYGFARHKGYCTKAHAQALRRLGPCPAHRRSFAPVGAAEILA